MNYTPQRCDRHHGSSKPTLSQWWDRHRAKFNQSHQSVIWYSSRFLCSHSLNHRPQLLNLTPRYFFLFLFPAKLKLLLPNKKGEENQTTNEPYTWKPSRETPPNQDPRPHQDTMDPQSSVFCNGGIVIKHDSIKAISQSSDILRDFSALAHQITDLNSQILLLGTSFSFQLS